MMGPESIEDEFMMPATMAAASASGNMTPTRDKMFGEGGVGFEHGRYGV